MSFLVHVHRGPTSVLDANRETIGTVIGSELSSRTREPTCLLIELSDDARELLQSDEAAVWLPYELVASIRRGEVQLADALAELVEARGARFDVHGPVDVSPGSASANAWDQR